MAKLNDRCFCYFTSVGAPPRNVSIQSSMIMGEIFLRITQVKNCSDLNRGEVFLYIIYVPVLA